jgi:hypothetical protein
VVGVFSDCGFSIRHTGRTGDGGIDAILDLNGALVAVQVKRSRNAIEVEQIHSFIGAIVRRGVTQGVYVTTSRYTRGAIRAVEDMARIGTTIRLVDAPALLHAIQLTTRPAYRSLGDLLEAVGGSLDMYRTNLWYGDEGDVEHWSDADKPIRRLALSSGGIVASPARTGLMELEVIDYGGPR